MKLPASTIIESVMAMTLTLIAITVGMLVFNTVLRTDAFQPKNVAYAEVQAWVSETKNQQSFHNDTRSVLYLSLTKTVAPFIPTWKNTADLIQLTITANDERGFSLYTHQEVLFIK